MMSDTAYMYFTIPGDTVTYQTVYVNAQSDASLPHADKVNAAARRIMCSRAALPRRK